MKPDTGRHVDVEIGMVHAVQPPQRVYRVKKHVLQIDGEIEQATTTAVAKPKGKATGPAATPRSRTRTLRLPRAPGARNSRGGTPCRDAVKRTNPMLAQAARIRRDVT